MAETTALQQLGPVLVDTFASEELAYRELQHLAATHGYGLRRNKSFKNSAGKIWRRQLVCTRATPRGASSTTPRKRDNATSKACGCPFFIYMAAVSKELPLDDWRTYASQASTQHNHGPVQHISALPIHRRLHQEQTAFQDVVREESAVGRTNATTLAVLLKRDSTVDPAMVNISDIKNAKQSLRHRMLQADTPEEYLIKMLDRQDAFVRYSVDNHNRLNRLFIAPRAQIQLYAAHPDVLGLDNTYKTNRFSMPLLDICGSTGDNKTIQIAIAFLDRENTEAFVWALEQLQLLQQEYNIAPPAIIITDRDLACLNALGQVYPRVPSLVCTWHMHKDIERWARQHFDLPSSSQTTAALIPDSTTQLAHLAQQALHARTERDFVLRQKEILLLSPEAASYLQREWWQYREHCAQHCLQDVLHFGYSTSSWIESSHAALKRWLNNSRYDLLGVVEQFQHFWTIKAAEAERSLAKAAIETPHIFNNAFYSAVNHVIHRYALTKVEAMRQQLVRSPGPLTACSGIHSKTMGLPCIHQVRNALDNPSLPIRPTAFHPHWWVDRSATPDLSSIRVLAPQYLGTRRLQAYSRTGQPLHLRGAGITGTRRAPSRHEAAHLVRPPNAALAPSEYLQPHRPIWPPQL